MALLRRKSDRAEVLSKVPLFAGLSKKELNAMASYTTELGIHAGKTLGTQGELGREAMIVLQGKAAVRRNGRKIAELGEGDVLGEMSLVTNAPRTATVVASTDMVILLLDARDFSLTIEEHPGIAVKILHRVAQRLIEHERPF